MTAPAFVHEMFRAAALLHADRPALVGVDGLLTYRQLDLDSDRLAYSLQRLGAAQGSLVAIVSEQTSDLVTGILAALKAGCAFMPLDPATPAPRLAASLDQVRPSLVIASCALTDWVEASLPETGTVHVLDPRAIDGDGWESPVPAAWEADDLAYVFFTSGSSGAPKAIGGRLKAIDHFIRWEIGLLGVGAETRSSQLIAPAFDAVLRDIFVPLCAGGALCIPPDRAGVLDAARLLAWLEEAEVALIHCVPTLWRSLLHEPLTASRLPALRHVLLAGERLLPADVGRWCDVFGDRIQLVNLYGPSETTMTKLYYIVRPEDRARASIPIGQPMPGAAVAILDSRGRPCPTGTVGEIYIQTPYLSRGYLNEPALSREAFLPDPFGQDATPTVYRTGDLGRTLADGNLEFLGRRDGQVKIRGVRVELGEVENALRQHPAVRDVAVVDREEPGGSTYLCAYLVRERETGPVELRQFLAGRLSEPMVPTRFVVLESLPRTLTGKVDRRALPEPSTLERFERSYEAPRTQTEELLAALWGGLLGLGQVGRDDDFFASGGHSLLATRLLSRVRAVFGVEIGLQVLFAAPTVAALASRIDGALRTKGSAGGAQEIAPVRRGELFPLSFAQQRLWLLERLRPGTAAYNIPAGVRLLGKLEIGAFRLALQELALRHEALRTSFVEREGVPLQRIAPQGALSLPHVDLSGLPLRAAREEEGRLAALEARMPFDLERSPLLRVWLLEAGASDFVVLFTMHHIVSDAWSLELLIAEVTELYSAAEEGRVATLPELRIQYVDFALWQRGWLEGRLLEEHLAYWRHRLAGPLPVLALPADRPRPEVASSRGRQRRIALPSPLVVQLRQLGIREGATLYMTLLAGFLVFLHRLSGQEDIVVGTAVAGRDHPATERLVGFFINMLPIRVGVSREDSFLSLLSRVRSVVLEAFAHQDLPFDKLVGELRTEGRAGASPLFDVAFGLRNLHLGKPPLRGLELRELERDHDAVRFDLTVWILEAPGPTKAIWSYNTDLFDDGTVARFHAQYLTVLSGLANTSEAPLSTVDLVGDEERARLAMERSARQEAIASSLRGLRRQRASGGESSGVVPEGTRGISDES